MLNWPVGIVILLVPLGCITCITIFDPLQYQLILVVGSNWKVHAEVLAQLLEVPLNIAVAVFCEICAYILDSKLVKN
jgi:hypothetical protein